MAQIWIRHAQPRDSPVNERACCVQIWGRDSDLDQAAVVRQLPRALRTEVVTFLTSGLLSRIDAFRSESPNSGRNPTGPYDELYERYEEPHSEP